MPPRTPVAIANSVFNLTSLLQSLPATSGSSAFTKCSSCLFSTTQPQEARKRHHQIRKRNDPYRIAQARQRKAANLIRREVLAKERKAALGNPIRSYTAPFVESLRAGAPIDTVKEPYLNYFVKPADVEKSLAYSKWLTEPVKKNNGELEDPERIANELEEFEAAHANAATALTTIASLENGNSKDRSRVNFARCIEEFGRHNTDNQLRPRPASKQVATPAPSEGDIKVPTRAGPDTGSSEVQIAILTAKINVLADNLHNKDKHNKRNLTLLVHKRQKLLAYLRKKERGGPRWQNLIEKLGISDAMWRGEITL